MNRKQGQQILQKAFIAFLYILLLTLQSLAQDVINIDSKTTPYTLEIVSRSIDLDPYTLDFDICDLQGDGSSEIVMFHNSYELNYPSNFVVFNWDQSQLQHDQANLKGKILGGKCLDIQNDRTQEILIVELDSGQIFLNIYDMSTYEPTLLHRVKVDGIPLPSEIKENFFKIYPVKIVDWDKDASPELAIIVRTTYPYQPRGIWMINLKSGKTIFKKQLGPLIESAIFQDIDNDGREEIILTNDAPNNCAQFPDSLRYYNGTDDSQTWFFIIDDDGKFLTKIPLARYTSSVQPLVKDLNHDGNVEILLSVSAASMKNFSRIAFYNLKTGVLVKDRQRQVQLILPIRTMDYNEDGIDEILTLWKDGILEIRNIQNEVLLSVRTGYLDWGRLDVMDIENDGKKEICLLGLNRLLILNSEFTPLLIENKTVNKISLVSSGFRQERYLYLHSDGEAALYDVKQNLLPASTLYRIFPFFLTASLTFVLILTTVFFVQKASKRMITTSLLPTAASLLLDSRGNIRQMNPQAKNFFTETSVSLQTSNILKILAEEKWKTLIYYIGECLQRKQKIGDKEIIINHKGRPRYFLFTMLPWRPFFLLPYRWILSLQETTELVNAKQTIAWASMAQRMAHEIKTPLSSMLLAAQQLNMKLVEKYEPLECARYVKHILNQIYRLRDATDAFMKFAELQKSNFQPVSAHEIINACLDEIAKIIPQNIRLETYLMSESPLVFADKAQVVIALSNILKNAITANDGEGIISITSSLVQSLQSMNFIQSFIRIEISDTGRGIPAEQLDHIFEPFYSQSEGGTGLGLTIAKKIIMDHHGKIEVRSQVGIGTSFFVELPVYQKS